MHGRNSKTSEGSLNRNPPLFRHPEFPSQQCLCRSGAEANDDPRFHRPDLGLQPWEASPNFRSIGLGMDPPLAPWFPLEVFDGVGNVNFAAIDPRLRQRPVQQHPSGTDEGLAGEILLIAGLLPDEHHPSLPGSRSEHRLRSRLVEIAGGAAGRGQPQIGQG